ncbi:MAG: type IV toxin-antitoxin system AbiEi family antitoxin domain-containing protein [Thermoleophilia bacterium]
MARRELQTRQFLERTPVFTTQQFRAALPPGTPPSTVNNRLSQAHERGYVERVVRGVYASQIGLFRDRMPDPLLVASLLTPDSVIAYHSALEAHGVAHSPFRRVTFVTGRTPVSLTYRGYEFIGLSPKPSQQRDGTWRMAIEPIRRGDTLIQVTSRERTLVDCLDRLQWSGGPEELIRSVGGFASVDVEKLLSYLDAVQSPAVAARVAWVLFADPDLWHLTNDDRERFQHRLGKGPYFFGPREEASLYARDWHLYVPADLDPVELLKT